MAAYSVLCYLLQIKDRHNGNIMITAEGHIVHIDFGFMLSSSPGGNLNFESSPFKLTSEYIEVMDGEKSPAFQRFCSLVITGFLEIRKHAHKIIMLVDLMRNGNMTAYLAGGNTTVDMLRCTLDTLSIAPFSPAISLFNFPQSNLVPVPPSVNSTSLLGDSLIPYHFIVSSHYFSPLSAPFIG